MFSSASEHIVCIHSIIKKITTLQVPMQLSLKILSSDRKRISVSISGSLTLETSLALPLFIFALTCFLYLGQILFLETRIQNAMEITGEKVATYSYAAEIFQNGELEEKEKITSIGSIAGEFLTGGFTAAYVQNDIVEQVGREFLDHSCVKGGSEGISLLGSAFSQEDSMVDLIISYQMKLPFSIFSGIKMKITQRCRRRMWTGIDEKKSDLEQIVYVTANGTVYHTSLECSYLKLKISEVTYNQIKDLRNDSGGRYYACELCTKGSPKVTVYITCSGEKYHNRLTCSGLTRGVRSIPLSKAGALPVCSRCKGGGNK